MTAGMAAIIADLERHKRCFDLTENNLASDVAEAFASAVFEQMETESDPHNAPWVPLADSYAAWKARHFAGRKIGELHLLMKNPEQLRGELDVAAARMTQTYGLDDQAKNEASWFSEGNSGQNRPPRPFYELNDLALVYLAAVFDARFHACFA